MFRQMPRCRGVDRDLEVGACDLKVTVEVIFQMGRSGLLRVGK